MGPPGEVADCVTEGLLAVTGGLLVAVLGWELPPSTWVRRTPATMPTTPNTPTILR